MEELVKALKQSPDYDQHDEVETRVKVTKLNYLKTFYRLQAFQGWDRASVDETSIDFFHNGNVRTTIDANKQVVGHVAKTVKHACTVNVAHPFIKDIKASHAREEPVLAVDEFVKALDWVRKKTRSEFVYSDFSYVFTIVQEGRTLAEAAAAKRTYEIEVEQTFPAKRKRDAYTLAESFLMKAKAMFPGLECEG